MHVNDSKFQYIVDNSNQFGFAFASKLGEKKHMKLYEKQNSLSLLISNNNNNDNDEKCQWKYTRAIQYIQPHSLFHMLDGIDWMILLLLSFSLFVSDVFVFTFACLTKQNKIE